MWFPGKSKNKKLDEKRIAKEYTKLTGKKPIKLKKKDVENKGGKIVEKKKKK